MATATTAKPISVDIDCPTITAEQLIYGLDCAVATAEQLEASAAGSRIADEEQTTVSLRQWLGSKLNIAENVLLGHPVLKLILQLGYMIAILLCRVEVLQAEVKELRFRKGRKNSEMSSLPSGADKYGKRRRRRHSRSTSSDLAEAPSQEPAGAEEEELPQEAEQIKESTDDHGDDSSDTVPDGEGSENKPQGEGESEEKGKSGTKDDPRYAEMHKSRDRSLRDFPDLEAKDSAAPNRTSLVLPGRDEAEYQEPVNYKPDRCQACPKWQECAASAKSCGTFYSVGAKVTITVTPHVQLKLSCPELDGEVLRGSLPPTLAPGKGYDPSVKSNALAVHYLGYASERSAASLMDELFGFSLGKSSLGNWKLEAAKNIQASGTLDAIRNALLGCAYWNHDETGRSVNGQLHWVPVIATPLYALYHINRARGYDGISSEEIVKFFDGTCVHDFWKPYFKLPDWVTHALCNSHVIRELLGVAVFFEEDYTWASELITLLISGNRLRQEWISQGKTEFTPEIIQLYESKYQSLVDEGLALHPEKHGEIRALAQRLKDHMDKYLLFLHCFEVPFTNNNAEVALRGVVLHEKVSMSMRSEEISSADMIIYSYIGTCQRQGLDIHEALKAAFEGRCGQFLFPNGFPEMPESARKHKAELEAKEIQEQQERKELEENLKVQSEELEDVTERISEVERVMQESTDLAHQLKEKANQSRTAAKASNLTREEKAELKKQAEQQSAEATKARQKASEQRTQLNELKNKKRKLTKFLKGIQKALGIKSGRKANPDGKKSQASQDKTKGLQTRKKTKASILDQVRKGVSLDKLREESEKKVQKAEAR